MRPGTPVVFHACWAGYKNPPGRLHHGIVIGSWEGHPDRLWVRFPGAGSEAPVDREYHEYNAAVWFPQTDELRERE